MTFFLIFIFYNVFGDYMTVYVDIVFLINFIMDFYILSSLKFLLKLNTKLFRIILSSLIGGLSIIILFFKLNNLEINIIKFIISILMILIAFGKYKFFNRLFYLYVISIILGGSIYLINDSFYNVDSFIFINNGYKVNIIILIIISPIILYLYIKEYRKLKKRLNTIYQVKIKINKKIINLEGFLDTGNKLKYFNRPIILVNKKYIDLRGKKVFYVPFNSLNNNGLLKCIKPEYILIDNKYYKDVYIGISEVNLCNDCILNERLFDI